MVMSCAGDFCFGQLGQLGALVHAYFSPLWGRVWGATRVLLLCEAVLVLYGAKVGVLRACFYFEGRS